MLARMAGWDGKDVTATTRVKHIDKYIVTNGKLVNK